MSSRGRYTARTEREALARVKALHPDPQLTVEERADLRFVSINFPEGGSVTFPALDFYAVSILGGPTYLREDSSRRGLVRSPTGSVLVQARHTSMEYAWHRKHVSWALCVDASELEQAAQETSALNPQRIEIISRTGTDATAAHMIRALGAQANADGHPGQELACTALRKAMALHMLAHYGAFAASKRRASRGLSARALKRGIAYLEENLNRSCSLEELAGEMGTSSFRVEEQFRSATGETPAEFVDRIRVERVQRLMTQPRVDAANFLLGVGFPDVASLYRVFRRVSGVSLEEFALQRGTTLDWLPRASEKPS